MYKKKDSFVYFKNIKKSDFINTKKKILDILENKKKISAFNNDDKLILNKIIEDLKKTDVKKKPEEVFSLKENTLAEINSFDDDYKIISYLVHRYRYEIFPVTKEKHYYPPLIQIEPSSICNFRCVFCFETDKSFTNKKNGFMGTMSLNIYKKIIDEIENKVEFITLASRGEPLVNNGIIEMLKYSNNKFLNLKLNTNASLLTEEKIHAILSNGVKTLVFSADAAEPDLYKKLRVNGSLETTLKNIKLFNKIKNKDYSNNKIITRVSGVKFSKDQDFDSMLNLWGNLVDQVVFVDYNPWENSYEKDKNNLLTPCSDLWRRMFIWWDGTVNPCDVDYKSYLKVGNIEENSIKNLWNSESYKNLRTKHLNRDRKSITPCGSCTVV